MCLPVYHGLQGLRHDQAADQQALLQLECLTGFLNNPSTCLHACKSQHIREGGCNPAQGSILRHQVTEFRCNCNQQTSADSCKLLQVGTIDMQHVTSQQNCTYLCILCIHISTCIYQDPSHVIAAPIYSIMQWCPLLQVAYYHEFRHTMHDQDKACSHGSCNMVSGISMGVLVDYIRCLLPQAPWRSFALTSAPASINTLVIALLRVCTA